MSFCATNEPEGDRFRGVVIVKEAKCFHEAFKEVCRLGINPGGECIGAPMPDNITLPEEYFGILLDDDTATLLSHETDRQMGFKSRERN